ncbi:MAG: hypothetical protein QHH19_01205 [Candidatus Thermoplasmatota archaeon]|nr:hypothetical protein [Candidatus Thermoplasmatota archaeon]
MRNNIFVIGAIALFLAMTLIPATTATIKTPEITSSESKTLLGEKQSWSMARIFGLYPGNSPGTIINVEKLEWDSKIKIGKNYLYKNLRIIGEAEPGPSRNSELTIGIIWPFISPLQPYTIVSINAKSFINFGFELKIYDTQ